MQYLVLGILENFNKMRESLRRKHELALDRNARAEFDRLQRYHDEFAHSQHNLLTFAQQQQYYQQRHQQQHQQNQQQSPNYTVPPTPQEYRQRVKNNYNQQPQPRVDSAHMQQYHQHYNSQTPRQSKNYQPNNRWMNSKANAHSNGYFDTHTHRQQPQSTSAIPDRKFNWNKNAWNAHQQQQSQQPHGHMNGMRNNSQTPRLHMQNGKGNRGKNGNVDIPEMAYVIIGSTMSALLS